MQVKLVPVLPELVDAQMKYDSFAVERQGEALVVKFYWRNKLVLHTAPFTLQDSDTYSMAGINGTLDLKLS